MSEPIAFTLNGQATLAQPGESIFQAAQRHGVAIPHLCYTEGLRADGNCRACVVEIAGERVLSPSCCRAVTPGMQVQTDSERAVKSQKMVVELLLSDMPDAGYKWNDADALVENAAGAFVARAAEVGAEPQASWCEHKSACGSTPTPASFRNRGYEDSSDSDDAQASTSAPVGELAGADLCSHHEAPASSPARAAHTTNATPAKSPPSAQQHGELSAWASKLGVTVRPALRALRRPQPKPDLSHPAMAVHLDACIQCTRCVRACREVQVNGVIGTLGRGAHSQIGFDLADPMGTSTCVACGECVQACPTGALSAKTLIGSQAVDRQVDSVCPFCGVGCLITYNIRNNTIVSVDGRKGPANDARLCVKGRFGFDYVHNPQRLTVPLIRKSGVVKDPALLNRLNRNSADWSAVFREASWDEALAIATGGLKDLRERFGPKALAGFGSAKGSNEEAYLFQKLVRTGFGSNNVDHCTRLCHASSVAALLEGVGSGSVTNPVRDVEHAELIFVIGSNPSSNHPVAATWIKNAVQRGARLVLADPRITDLGVHAWRTLAFRADMDVALLNALIHTIIEEGLSAPEFIAQRASNFEALKANVQGYSPEAMAPLCGIPAPTLREVARAYATAKASMILWGMGVSQHVHGTDNVRCLIALATVAGQLGRPGTGLHPLRGQNNVQGASDAGLIPMMFPNYQRVNNPQAHAWFEDFWNTKLDDAPGYTVVEIMDKALAPENDPHKVRGMVIMGENPAMSDPDLHHARAALASLSHLVVQDIFMTETAWLADVVLPASAWPEKTGTVSNTDRMVQLGRQALQPPGDARADLWILQRLAAGMGLPWNYENDSKLSNKHEGYHGVELVYEEMRQAMHGAIGGISWERLQREDSVTYPCHGADDPGQAILFQDHVNTPDGRIHLVPADIIPANERPDADYPFVLITGRLLEHWHTGSMTRRSQVLDALEPHASASLCSADLHRLGVRAGDVITVRSRRGAVTLRARQDEGTPPGTIFMPFAYHEAAANLMTNPALDPVGKIPEVKYCAVAVQVGGTLAESVGYA